MGLSFFFFLDNDLHVVRSQNLKAKGVRAGVRNRGRGFYGKG